MSDADMPTMTDLASDLASEAPNPDVNTPAEPQEPATPAPSTDETTAPEVTDPPKEDEPAANPDEPAPTEADKSRGGKAEERKDQLTAEIKDLEENLDKDPAPQQPDPNAEIRDLVARRNALRQSVEQRNAQVYGPQQVDEIMRETGQSESDARITAMEQRQELTEYNNQVAEAQLYISSESERVLTDFPMFNPDSTEFKPEVAAAAADVLRANLILDPNTGQVIGSHVSPYQIYQTIDMAGRAGAVENQIQGQRNAQATMANVEPDSSAVPATPAEDPFLAGLTRGLTMPGE